MCSQGASDHQMQAVTLRCSVRTRDLSSHCEAAPRKHMHYGYQSKPKAVSWLNPGSLPQSRHGHACIKHGHRRHIRLL